MADIINKKGAQELLPMCVRTLDYLIAADLIPYRRANPKPGGKGHRTLLFSKRQLLKWVEEGNAPSSVYNECGSPRAEAVG
jgi:hypothetical protein